MKNKKLESKTKDFFLPAYSGTVSNGESRKFIVPVGNLSEKEALALGKKLMKDYKG